METTTFPDSQNVLADLKIPLQRVVEALQTGVPEARKYFLDYQREPIDRNLFPDLVRYQVKRALQQAGHEAVEEDSDPGEFQERVLARNGLVVSAGQYELRILKSDRGALPRPHSTRRRDFYNQDRWRAEQTSLLDGQETSDQVKSRTLALVALWDVTSTHDLANVFLVCPKVCLEINGPVLEAWYEPLLVVGQTITYDFSTGEPAPPDLDITRKGDREPEKLEPDEAEEEAK